MVRQQRLVALGVAVTLGLAAFVAGTPHARAAFVGKNGFIALSADKNTGKFDIWTISASGTGANNLTAGNGLKDSSPSFSPEKGVHIAWVASRTGCRGGCQGDIWVMDNRGGHKFNATRTSDSDEQGPSWAVSGGVIAFSRAPASGGTADIWTILWTGANPQRLTTSTANDIEPAYAPVGRLIAFVSNRSGSNGIYVMNPSGADVRLLAMNGRTPNWAPQGDRIAFVRGGNVWTMASNGTAQRQLTTSGTDSEPAYSPDGRRLVFQRGRVVMVMNLDGSGVRRVTGTAFRAAQPDWRPECNFDGGDGPDHLVGTAAPELFCGGPGADTIEAKGGSDAIYGGPGADTVYAGGGNDFVEGGNETYNDTLYGQHGDDFLMGNSGNDVVSGGTGSDFLLGGPGDDRVLGSDGVYGNDGVVGMQGDERKGDSCSADVKSSLRLPHDNVSTCEHMI
jgi:Tol biopolymer transport system component